MSPLTLPRDVKSMSSRRKREISPVDFLNFSQHNLLDMLPEFKKSHQIKNSNVGSVKFPSPKRAKRWLYDSLVDDDETEMKKPHRKPSILKRKKKKGQKKHKKTETMSSYMKGMKDAVEDNLWE